MMNVAAFMLQMEGLMQASNKGDGRKIIQFESPAATARVRAGKSGEADEIPYFR